MEKIIKNLEGSNEEEVKKAAEQHAKEAGIKLNPNEQIVKGIIKGLLMKREKNGELYCPCRILTGDKAKDAEIICPCVYHRGEIELDKHCHCNLFVGAEN